MRRFLVCIHDVTPAYADETRQILRDLGPMLGRRLSLGVVPDWHGRWPLPAYPEYCRLLRESAGELLLHGCMHQRQRGRGPISLLTDRADEMNGLDRDETWRVIERGQRIFVEVFGAAAAGFLPPAWQRGHVRPGFGSRHQLEHVLGFFALESRTGRSIPLATWSWDCGRWRPIGHVGHAAGLLLGSLDGRVPVLAIHPLDLKRGFWPKILRLTERLLEAGHEPGTPAALIEACGAEAAV